MSLIARIHARYPHADPLDDFTIVRTAHGERLVAWRINGPLPVGVSMNQTATQEWETRYRSLRDQARALIAESQQMDLIWQTNPEIADAMQTANAGELLDSSTLSKETAQHAAALMQSLQAWLMTPVADGMPSALQVLYKRD